MGKNWGCIPPRNNFLHLTIENHQNPPVPFRNANIPFPQFFFLATQLLNENKFKYTPVWIPSKQLLPKEPVAINPLELKRKGFIEVDKEVRK